MKASSVLLLGVLLAATALVMAGCLQPASPDTSYSGAAATLAPSPSPDAARGVSPTPSGVPDDGGASQDLDAAGSDLGELESLSDDLSVGDVEYSEG